MADKNLLQNSDNSDRESPSGYHSDSGLSKQTQINGMQRVDSEIELNFDASKQRQNRSSSPYNLRSRPRNNDVGGDKKSRTCPAKREMSPSQRFIQRRFSIGVCPPLDFEKNRAHSISPPSEFCFGIRTHKMLKVKQKTKGCLTML